MSANPKSKITNQKSLILLLCLISFALRLGPAFDNRFHPDEALFSAWALKIARGENLLLTRVPVDKPPLLIYLTALSFFFFGQTEIAARFVNLAASVIGVVLLYRLAQHQLRDDFMVLPPLLLAFSPFAILFAPTAFLDPAMIMFGLASLVAASRRRAGWAGLLLGLSAVTKVQGLLFAPLVLIFWSKQGDRDEADKGLSRLSICPSLYLSIHFCVSFLIVALIVLAWDRARGGLPFWIQQTINYGGIRVIYPSEVWPRVTGWLSFLPYFFGPIVGIVGLASLPILLYFDLTRDVRTRMALIDLALLTYCISVFALHWLLAFPVWDRYFLILVPMMALLIGHAIRRLIDGLNDHLIRSRRHLVSHSLILSIVLIGLLPFGLAAAESQYPIGGDHGANDGIEQVAAYLKDLPSGTVVYDHWLAWELSYYLGEGHVYLAYFDTPAALADDLRAFAKGDDRYVVFPAYESPNKTIDAIGQVGYTLSPVFATLNRFNAVSFNIYRIVKRDA